jgi:hypothetical protein
MKEKNQQTQTPQSLKRKLIPYFGPWTVILNDGQVLERDMSQDQAISLATSESGDSGIVSIDAQHCTVHILDRSVKN